jgi:aspartate/methionine/tyrosine aminotransferase
LLRTDIKPAERSGLIGFSDIVKIRNRVLEMKAAGQKVLQLEGGEPFMPTPDFIKKAMIDALNANLMRSAPNWRARTASMWTTRRSSSHPAARTRCSARFRRR